MLGKCAFRFPWHRFAQAIALLSACYVMPTGLFYAYFRSCGACGSVAPRKQPQFGACAESKRRFSAVAQQRRMKQGESQQTTPQVEKRVCGAQVRMSTACLKSRLVKKRRSEVNEPLFSEE
jgi:hypothetical protein